MSHRFTCLVPSSTATSSTTTTRQSLQSRMIPSGGVRTVLGLRLMYQSWSIRKPAPQVYSILDDSRL